MSHGFGAFGKIPALGDFMRVNVAAGFVQPWDTWLQEGITAVRNTLGDQWDDAYLTAPIWRFTLPAGMAGPSAMLGILMASVDRVGRQYPLTLTAPLQTHDIAAAHFANTHVFELLEQTALKMLDDDGTREALVAALEPLIVVDGSTDFSLPYVSATPPEYQLAGKALSSSVGDRNAIWSTVLQDDHRLMTTATLPQGRDMQALFDLSPATWRHPMTEFT